MAWGGAGCNGLLNRAGGLRSGAGLVVYGSMLKSILGLVMVLLGLAGLAVAQEVLRPGDNLVVEGVPAVPRSLVTEVQRYTEARSASFGGWHPQRLEMLVGTRFGNSAQVHHVAAPRGMRRQLTFFEEPVSSLGYDPVAAEFFLFSWDAGGSEFRQIYRHDLASGEIALLTDGGRSQNGSVEWSRSGEHIAYTSTRRNGRDRDIYVMDPRRPETDRLVVELRGGGWGVGDWSPDDGRLLVGEYVSVNESHLWLLELATGEMRPLTPRDRAGVAQRSAAFAPDGRGVYLTTDLDSEFARLAHLDLATGETRFLSSAIAAEVTGFTLTEDGRHLVFHVNDAGFSRLYLMELAGHTYRAIEGLPAGVYGGMSWHADGRHLAVTVNSARSPSDVQVVDIVSGAVTRWTESELGGLVAEHLSEPEPIRWTSFDGLEITGFMYRPPARWEGRRPVIISIHGGPEAQSRPVFLGRNNYYLNELGAALIYPNVRGSTGFGKTFVALDNGYLRENAVRDIGALLDWVAEQPDLDAGRVMVMGGSYGGYMTLASAIHFNDRIRCSLSVVGISNFVTFLQNTEDYRRDLRRVEYGDERDLAMRTFLEQISPTTRAAEISQPLFIVQGANDPRVPRTEAVQMVETVRHHGSPVWYLEAKDEGHGFRKKANADFQFYATVLFIREHLLP
jgi:dipeptidyl aminopeptidase/acylaminoacyl peptidase